MQEKELRDLIDQAILSTGYNLVLSGESEEECINTLVQMGWDRDKSEFVIKHITQNFSEDTSFTGVALVLTLFLVTLVIFFWGGALYRLPSPVGWRLLASFGFALIPQLIFVGLWALLSGVLGGRSRD